MTGSVLEKAMEKGNFSKEPLADLQRDILAIARGLSPGGPESLSTALNHSEEVTMETEHHGALFVQKQIRDFLARMKEEHLKNEQKEKEDWVVM